MEVVDWETDIGCFALMYEYFFLNVFSLEVTKLCSGLKCLQKHVKRMSDGGMCEVEFVLEFFNRCSYRIFQDLVFDVDSYWVRKSIVQESYTRHFDYSL